MAVDDLILINKKKNFYDNFFPSNKSLSNISIFRAPVLTHYSVILSDKLFISGREDVLVK